MRISTFRRALSVAVAFPTFMGGAFAGIRFHSTKSQENHKAKSQSVLHLLAEIGLDLGVIIGGIELGI